MWQTAIPETTNQLSSSSATGRVVDVLAYTTEGEIPGCYRVRDDAGRIIVVSADEVIGEVEFPRV